jgi:hypothetical protein
MLLSLAFLSACGSSTEEPGPSAAVDASDLGTLFDISGDVNGQDSATADTALLDLGEGLGGDSFADAAVADAAVAGDGAADGAKSDGGDAACGEAGCACSQNSTCNTGLCLEIGASKQCAALCVSGCPQGLKCSQISGSGGDVISVCTEINPRLCEPCGQDSDCNTALGGADNRCVNYTDNSGSQLGYFCSTPCSDTSPCPGGYACQEKLSAGGVKSKQCVRRPAGPQHFVQQRHRRGNLYRQAHLQRGRPESLQRRRGQRRAVQPQGRRLRRPDRRAQPRDVRRQQRLFLRQLHGRRRVPASPQDRRVR